MIVEVSKEPLPQELLDICRNTFETHLSMPGLTSKGHMPEYRETECRYIQRAKREGAEHPRGIQLMEEWINDYGYPDLTPEILQIARYHRGHFYKWHTDGDGRMYRKLSMSCLLNDPSEFVGGEMEFKLPDKYHRDGIVMQGQKTEIKLQKEYQVLFGSDIPHQVCPVWEGQRDSLVVWFTPKK